MTMEKIKEAYEHLCQMDDTDDGIFEFKDLLLSNDDDDVLKYHLKIIQECKIGYLRTELSAFFEERKDKEKVSSFLYKEFKKSSDDLLRADIIQMLGGIKECSRIQNEPLNSPYALELANENIKSGNRDFRYRSIIVIGWVGSTKDLPILNERMLHDNDGELRGYGATAMRQIWFKLPETREQITEYIRNAIEKETNEKALIGMIITIEELYRKKLGIKESTYGDVSGDVQKAKEKTIKFLATL